MLWSAFLIQLGIINKSNRTCYLLIMTLFRFLSLMICLLCFRISWTFLLSSNSLVSLIIYFCCLTSFILSLLLQANIMFICEITRLSIIIFWLSLVYLLIISIIHFILLGMSKLYRRNKLFLLRIKTFLRLTFYNLRKFEYLLWIKHFVQ